MRQQLHALETLLREHRHWRLDAPQYLLTIFMDTMEPLEWLQWVLIHVYHTLLDVRSRARAFAALYYEEMALADHPRSIYGISHQDLYQDPWLVAVNKPAGWLVHRSWLDRDEKVVVMQTVRPNRPACFSPHLDRPTSGVLLIRAVQRSGDYTSGATVRAAPHP